MPDLFGRAAHEPKRRYLPRKKTQHDGVSMTYIPRQQGVATRAVPEQPSLRTPTQADQEHSQCDRPLCAPPLRGARGDERREARKRGGATTTRVPG